MPPSKRAKKSSSAVPASPSKVLTDAPQAEPADIKSTESTPTSVGSADTIDPALLDEEETPGAGDFDSTVEKTWHGKGYNALKTFKGQVYSGMAVGGSHTWKYDEGMWTETKAEPDLWGIDYAMTKRRARHAAPRGSSAPVGTEYHWLVVAHQYVKKLDANTYNTHLVGSKYKLAHKAEGAGAWSVPTVLGQREHEVVLLEDAKHCVLGLPLVLPHEKVKVEKREKGQQRLDSLFSKAGGGVGGWMGLGRRGRGRRGKG